MLFIIKTKIVRPFKGFSKYFLGLWLFFLKFSVKWLTIFRPKCFCLSQITLIYEPYRCEKDLQYVY